jgi:hypothetical protein
MHIQGQKPHRITFQKTSCSKVADARICQGEATLVLTLCPEIINGKRP